MNQIVSLFENSKEAQQAMTALESASIGEGDIRIVEEWDEMEETKPQVVPVPNLDPGMTGVPVAGISNFGELNISDDAKMFLKRSLQSGGSLLIIDLENGDELARAKNIIRENDGRIAGD